jgi:peroxiredoxin
MYQPRARKALEIMLQKMTREEWLIFYRSQLVLNRHREISQVFVDGLVGKNFSKALSFYLDRYEQYLIDMEKFGLKRRWA